MRAKVMILMMLFICVHTVYSVDYDPLLVVVIMVKNEEAVMRATLQPFVDGGIQSFFVFDTGSTDRTIEVTREFFDEYGITQGYIEQEPFIDFATSRNRALDLAHERFANAAFMIMPDAEWYLNDAQLLLNFCQTCLQSGDRYSAYLIHIVNDYLDNYSCRLIRCHTGARFFGVVHEVIPQAVHVKVPDTIYFKYLPASNGVEKSNARFVRDRELLYKEYLQKPWCTRTLFYLARVCEDLGEWQEAYDLYKIRVKMKGWDAEDYMAHYRLAETIKKLVIYGEEKREQYQWSEALMYYLQAYSMSPHRAEPLVEIADYYAYINDMSLAFLFARRAVDIPYPAQDLLFIQKYAYEYYRYELLARSAWYVGEFEIGEWAARKAYQVRPDYVYAQQNMNCYLLRT
jgi:hypothetical protein